VALISLTKNYTTELRHIEVSPYVYIIHDDYTSEINPYCRIDRTKRFLFPLDIKEKFAFPHMGVINMYIRYIIYVHASFTRISILYYTRNVSQYRRAKSFHIRCGWVDMYYRHRRWCSHNVLYYGWKIVFEVVFLGLFIIHNGPSCTFSNMRAQHVTGLFRGPIRVIGLSSRDYRGFLLCSIILCYGLVCDDR
jgi:hypothetical protein